MVIAIFCILFLLIICSTITFICYLKTFYNKNFANNPYLLPKGEAYERKKEYMYSLIKEMETIPYEPICIISNDKLKLFGRYYHANDNAPIHLQCHGYKGVALRDFCGGNKITRELKHNTLLIDQRAHGKSGGVNITFGIKESEDIHCWIKYCIERFGKDVKIILSGVSMGASSVLMCANNPLPDNVIGIFADSPYSSPKDIICKVIQQMKLPSKIFYPFVYMAALIFAGCKLNEKSALSSISKCTVPILIVHGESDSLVPYEMSKKLHDANPEMVTLEIFKNADHGLSFIEDSPRYNKAIKDFVDKLKI